MDFRNAVIESLDKVIASGKIEEMIEAKLTKTIESILDDALRSYGDFGKSIGEQVNASLKIDEHLGLPAYNDLVLKIVQRQIDTQIGGAMQSQLAEQLADLLKTPPAEVKLSDLTKEFSEFAIKDIDRDHSDYFTFGMEQSSRGYRHLWFDPKGGKSQYSCKYRLGVTSEGRVFTLSIDGENPDKRLFVGPFYNFERTLFQMKVAGTKLIFDCEVCDIETYYQDECHCD